MSGGKVKLLCSFGGEFYCHPSSGKVLYKGGNTRMVTVDRGTSFSYLSSRMAELCNTIPSSIHIKFQFPGTSLDSPLVSIECDDDVANMMDEFQNANKISIFLFTPSLNREDMPCILDEVIPEDNDKQQLLRTTSNALSSSQESPNARIHNVLAREDDAMLEEIFPACSSKPIMPVELQQAENAFGSSQECPNPSGSNSEFGRMEDDFETGAMATLDNHFNPCTQLNGQDPPFLIGQEFSDAKAFRNAIRDFAIATSFKYQLVKNESSRVTAKCAATGCPWRIHASKLRNVKTLKVKTFKDKHTCPGLVRPYYRRLSKDWIASCIKDRVRLDINYKPRQIVKDIQREHGMTINYIQAFRAKQKAVAEIFGPDFVTRNPRTPGRPRKVVTSKPVARLVQPSQCSYCKQPGHNKRSCKIPALTFNSITA